MKKKFVLIGPRVPPYTGQSVSFEMLTEGFREKGLFFKCVDISRGQIGADTTNRLIRVTEILISLVKYIYIVGKWNPIITYLTIAQSKMGFFRDFGFLASSFIFNVKTIVHLKGGNYHGFYTSQGTVVQFLVRWVLKRVSKIVVLDCRLIEMFDFDPSLASKIVVVPNGLPYDAIPNTKLLRCAKNLPVRLLFLSNMIHSKGYLDVLRSASILQERFEIDCSVTFCGQFLKGDYDGSDWSAYAAEQHFWETVKQLGLTSSVTFNGSVTGAEKARVLEECDFFCLPTVYRYEGQPVSIIEAMSYGAVILSTRYRAIPSLLVDGVNGLFVEAGRPETISEAIFNIIATDRFNDMSRASSEMFVSRFTKERHLSSLIEEITCLDFGAETGRDV